MKCLRISAVIAVILGLTAPAWAQNNNGSFSPGVTQNSATATGGQGGDGGTGVGIGIGQGGDGGNAAVIGSGNSSNVNVLGQQQGQGQAQGQKQRQAQGQGQDQGQQQKQQANNDGNHQSVNVDVPRQAPPAIPAALAVSSLTCYGSWSIAASTPFGGVGAGFPTKEKECERVRAALVFQALGHPAVALALMSMNEENQQAMKAAGVAIPGASAKVDTTMPGLKLNTPLGEPKEEKKSEESNFGTRAELTIPEALVANLAAQSVGAGL